MVEIRCAACSKLLARADYNRVQIKCPRCGTYNDLRARATSTQGPQPERPRASSPQGQNHDDKRPETAPPPRRKRL
jgi:phage FluMu protein Com